MCYLITLVVGGGDAGAIDHVLRRYGRRAAPFRNASLARVLAPGEAPFLTCLNQCDCGSALVPRASNPAERDRQAATRRKRAARLARLGWSRAKVDRWVSEHVQADAWTEEQRRRERADTLEMWSAAIAELVGLPGVRQAGLLLHSYSGNVETEALQPCRETVSIGEFEQRLGDLQEDQLLVAARSATG